MIIGLNGNPGTGKDTVANYLVAEHGFVRIAFADRLRELTAAINPIVGWRPTTGQCGCNCHNPQWGMHVHHVVACCHPTPGGPVHWNDAIEMYGGYEAARVHYPEMRRFQRYFGTECVRDGIDPNYWVEYVRKQAAHEDNVVIPDMRFWNEADAVRKWGGKTVLITRPGTEGSEHRSDNDLSDWSFDHVINNDGGFFDLYEAALDMVRALG